MMNKSRYPEPIEAIIVVLSAFAVIIVFTLFYDLLVYIGLISEESDKGIQSFYIFGGSLFIIVPWIYARYRQYDIKNLFRLNPVSLDTVIKSILIGISLTILSDELDRIVNIFFPMPDWLIKQAESLQAGNTFELILIFTGAVLIASVAEEGLFRGFLQYSLEKHGDVTRAVILSSISWTLIHMNFYWAVQLFLMGIVIGYTAWRTNSIFPAIIIHGVNNLIGIVFLNFDLAPHTNWYEQHGHVSPVVLVISAGILVWSVKSIRQIE